MAPPSPFQVKFVESNLEMLEQQKSHMVGVVEEFVNKVVHYGKNWIDNNDVEGSQMSFSELSHMLVSSTAHLCEVEQSLNSSSGNTSELDTASLSQTQQTRTAQENWSTKTVLKQDTGIKDLQKVLARVEVLEVAVSSLRSSTDKVTKLQAELDTTINDLSKKQGAFEEQNIRDLDQIKKTLKKQTTKKSEITKVNERLDEQDGKLNALSTQQTELTTKTNKKWSECERKLTEVSREQQEMDATVEVIEARLEEQTWHDMETKVLQLSEEAKETNTQVKKLTEKTGVLETGMSEVSNKTDANGTAINAISDDQKKVHAVLMKQRKQLKVVRKQRDEDLKDYKLKFDMVCQIVADHVTPLERLRKILNKKIATRNQNVDTLNTMVTDVKTLDNRLSHLESTRKQPVGFSAKYCIIPQTPPNRILTKYKTPAFNTGGCFDITTGQFQAPSDGMCLVVIRTRQYTSGSVDVRVYCRRAAAAAGDHTEEVCWTRTTGEDDLRCDAAVWPVKTGDQLYVETGDMSDDADIYHVMFSCFMLV